MKLHQFSSLIQIENDLNDFKLPYKIAGKIDLQVMQDKYNRLNNKPTHYLETRYTQFKW